MDPKAAVEAALFSAAGNLKISDIAAKTGVPEEDVRNALVDLRREYDMRGSAMIISKTGSDYRMVLRPEFSQFTDDFGKAEIPARTMRTLSTIAYNQPVLQSELVKTRGPGAYEDVQRLRDLDLISAKRSGQTLELTTTSHFSEYFGIGSTRKADIRKWIESRSVVKERTNGAIDCLQTT